MFEFTAINRKIAMKYVLGIRLFYLYIKFGVHALKHQKAAVLHKICNCGKIFANRVTYNLITV